MASAEQTVRGGRSSISKSDVGDFASVLNQISKSSGEMLSMVGSQLEASSDLTSKGISFLDVKNQTLLQYLIDLSLVSLRKTSGVAIAGNSVINRLVENRVVLEKLRPINRKLQYQIDKCIRVANTGVMSKDDPLSFRPNPLSMKSKLDENSEDGEDDESAPVGKAKVYQPPRLTAVHYDAEGEIATKEAALKKMRAKAMNSSVMKDLREDYSEEPLEIQSASSYMSRKRVKEAAEKQNFEEDHFVRLTTSKKKAQQRKMGTMSDLNSLTNFGGISALTGAERDTGKKRKHGKKQSHSKKGKKRKFK